ncbi:MAG: hypothetical protein IPJ97_09835 [Proteobacteria bacterium]|nr:hypothetical protein [Pseudomonadota bacterium]
MNSRSRHEHEIPVFCRRCFRHPAAAGWLPAVDQISYAKDVAPILDKHCKSCHVAGQAGYVVSGFELESYETLMKGTQYGPVVLPGDPLTSVLVMLIEGRADPSLKMPHGEAKPLEPAEVATIRQWVEQGAKNN